MITSVDGGAAGISSYLFFGGDSSSKSVNTGESQVYSDVVSELGGMQGTNSGTQSQSTGSSTSSQEYDEMDLNRDGTVTVDEIAAYLEQQQRNNLLDQIGDYLAENADTQAKSENAKIKQGAEAYKNNDSQFTEFAKNVLSTAAKVASAVSVFA